MTDPIEPIDLSQPAAEASRGAPQQEPQPAKYIKVDVEKEIVKMATIDGVTTPGDLMRPVTMPRREYYRAAIYAHYRGYDQGYANGVTTIGRPLRRVVVLVAVSFFSIGAAASAVMFMLVR